MPRLGCKALAAMQSSLLRATSNVSRIVQICNMSHHTQEMVYRNVRRESPDAYVVNSIGNCFNSLGQWSEAREAYLTSAQLFQQAKVSYVTSTASHMNDNLLSSGLMPCHVKYAVATND